MLETPLGVGGDLVLAAEDYRRDKKVWLRERRYGLGASEISIVLGLNKFATPLDLWREKTATAEPVEGEMPEAAYWGLTNEHNVATTFAKRNPHLGKIYPTPGILADPERPMIRATLDRLLVKRRVRPVQATAAVECKTVGDFAYKNYWADGLPPIHIQLQCQWQMHVTGLERVYVPHLVGGNWMPEAWMAERDQTVIDQIVAYGEAWWQDHVVEGKRPEVTFADMDKLSELWPGDASLAVMKANAEMLGWVGKHLDAKRRLKEAEEDKALAAFEIQKRMGDHEIIEDASGAKLVTWKMPKPQKVIDSKRLKEDHPEIYEQYLKDKNTSRTFVTKELEIA
jgi:putative phage-type endonuclease